MATAPSKKGKKHIAAGIVTVNAAFNNTMITFADSMGNTQAWSSGGKVGMKGARKGTPYAAQMAAEDVGAKMKELGVKSIDINVNGPGQGREAAVRKIAQLGFDISKIADVTPVPHNGVRPRKKPRK